MRSSTTIKRFHPHPLFILSSLRKYLFVLLIPVLRGLYYVLINSFSWAHGFHFEMSLSDWIQGVWVDILVSLIFLSLGILLWARFTVDISEEGILVQKGIFRRQVTFLPTSRFHCVLVVEPLHLKIFHAVQVRIDTPGGGIEKADLSLTMRRKDSVQMMNILRYPKALAQFSPIRSYTPKNRYVFILAMITSNSFAGIVLITTFITQVGNLLGRQFSEMIYGTFENAARALAFGIPPTALAIAWIMLFGYLCAFIGSLSRHANFNVVRNHGILKVKAGLFKKRRYHIQVDKIAYLDIRRSLLTLILGVYSVFLSTVGYGKFKDDVSALIPCVRKKRLKQSMDLLLPEYHLSEREVRPERMRSLFRYTWRAAGLLVLLLLGTRVSCLLFPSWRELILWVCLMASCPLVWLLAVKLVDLNTAGISWEQGCYTLRYSKGFSLHAIIIRPERIVKIKRTQSIFQKRKGKCDLYVYSYSEGKNVHHVRNLDNEKTEELFNL